jgi:hypothetical protein
MTPSAITLTDERNLIMSTHQIPEQIKKPKPLYAVVGAGEAVIERIRDLDPNQLQAQAKEFPTKAQAKATEAQAKANERLGTVVDDVKHLPEQLRTLPDRAQSVALQAFELAGDKYAEYAQRGELVVQRVVHKEATSAATKPTESAAKQTESTAKKTAKSTAAKTTPSASSKKSASKPKKPGESPS